MLIRTSPAQAPERREPGPRPRRPELRVVDAPPARDRMRPARVGTIAGALLFLALFALAAFQTVLIRAQDRLDDLNSQVSQQAEIDHQLQLQLADLQSPERIAQVARDRLGMIAPHTITFIEPAPDDDANALFVRPADVVPPEAVTASPPAPPPTGNR